MKKDIRNINLVAYKLRSALTKVINQKLEVVKEKKQKTKAIAAKPQKTREEIGSFSKKKGNCGNDTQNEMDPD